MSGDRRVVGMARIDALDDLGHPAPAEWYDGPQRLVIRAGRLTRTIAEFSC